MGFREVESYLQTSSSVSSMEDLRLFVLPFFLMIIELYVNCRRYLRVERKDSLRKLTDKHCDKLIKDKLDAYKEELSSKQKDFFKEKAEKLAFIRQEEIECGLAPTVSEEEIERARKKYESFK